MDEIFLWVKGLKKEVLNLLSELESSRIKGYYRYSYSGDLYDETKGNIAGAIFALKILYIFGIKESDIRVKNAINYIISFKNSKGEIYDKLIYRKTFIRNFLASLYKKNYVNLLNQEYKRAETRQAYSALKLFGYFINKDEINLEIPLSKEGINMFLNNLKWESPWGAGSHFSHLMFYLQYYYEINKISEKKYTELVETALSFIKSIQHEEDGFWYRGNPCIREKINGAMKIITGLKIINKVHFEHSNKIIDNCLLEKNNEHACDNFNIIYVLKYSNLVSQRYKINEIREFAHEKLNDYRKYYKNKGFSFHINKANDVYYGCRITKGIDEEDIHGTVLFLWGISIILQILDRKEKEMFKEFLT